MIKDIFKFCDRSKGIHRFAAYQTSTNEEFIEGINEFIAVLIKVDTGISAILGFSRPPTEDEMKIIKCLPQDKWELVYKKDYKNIIEKEN